MGGPLRFTVDALDLVPQSPGTYFLFRGPLLLFAGMAAGGATLRSELSAHLRGDFGARTRAATHFAWLATHDVLEAYRLQLAAHACWDLRANPKEESPCESPRTLQAA